MCIVFIISAHLAHHADSLVVIYKRRLFTAFTSDCNEERGRLFREQFFFDQSHVLSYIIQFFFEVIDMAI